MFDAPVSLSLKREPTGSRSENKWSPFASPPDAVKALVVGSLTVTTTPASDDCSSPYHCRAAVDEISATPAFDDIVAAATKQRIGTGIIEYVLCREVLKLEQVDPLIVSLDGDPMMLKTLVSWSPSQTRRVGWYGSRSILTGAGEKL